MKKLLWSMTGLTLFGGTLIASPAAASTGIVWGACPAPPAGVQLDPRQTCGTIRVPLDYRHPTGRQITIAVSRVPATDPAKRRGVLLINPGGPGGEGLDQPSAPVGEPVAATYDRIGFDPRGVGHSTPVTCGLTKAETLPVFPFPAPDGSIAGNIAYARSAAARCAQHSGDLLPYITTANTARDMDRIRQALGEPRVSYWGTSYGTYLGAVYATLFRDRTDRMLFDSAIDPTQVWYGVFRQQAAGLALRLPDAARHAPDIDYPALAARLDANPVTVPGAGVMTGNVFRFMTVILLHQDAAIPPLVQAWRATADLADGRPLDDGDLELMQEIFAALDPAAGTSPGVPEDNFPAAAYAVACDDARWPRDIGVYTRNVAADRLAYPLSAGYPANLWPCAFWPTAPIEPPVAVSAHGPRNIMILQNERDNAAPLTSGQSMHRALGTRSVLVTVAAGGHGVYGMPGPAECATRAADAFLADGTLPSHDVHCP